MNNKSEDNGLLTLAQKIEIEQYAQANLNDTQIFIASKFAKSFVSRAFQDRLLIIKFLNENLLK